MWNCKNCDEEIDDVFDECWKCSSNDNIITQKFYKKKSYSHNNRLYKYLILIIVLIYSIINTYFGKYGFMNNELIDAYNRVYKDVGINKRVQARGFLDMIPELLGSFVGIMILPIIGSSLLYLFTKKDFWRYFFIFQLFFTIYRLM